MRRSFLGGRINCWQYLGVCIFFGAQQSLLRKVYTCFCMFEAAVSRLVNTLVETSETSDFLDLDALDWYLGTST